MNPYDSAIEDCDKLLEKLGLSLQLFRANPAVPASQVELLEAILRLLKLFSFQVKETRKCFDAGAYFAANAVGAATLETLLLLLCVLSEQLVRATTAWKKAKKNSLKPYLELLGNMDLAMLMEIGQELAWFVEDGKNSNLRTLFVQNLGEEVTQELWKIIPPDASASASAARDARNKLHPAKCLREPFELTASTGIEASMCLMATMASLSKRLQTIGSAAISSVRP